MVGKAVIPIAGLGARMRPVTGGAPKALLPLAGRNGRPRAVIDWILAEARAAEIVRVGLIVSPSQRAAVEQHLAEARAPQPAVTFIEQPRPGGFGQAVLLARSFVGPDPVMVLLGDHVRLPAEGARACAAQVAEAAEGFRGSAVVGVQVVGEDQLGQVGVCAGDPVVADHVYRCRRIAEKPTPDQAAELVTLGFPPGRFLAHAGVYIFRPEIFSCLAELADQPGELGLTDAQQLLLRRHPEECYLVRVAGSVHDTGSPDGYADALTAFARRADA